MKRARAKSRMDGRIVRSLAVLGGGKMEELFV